MDTVFNVLMARKNLIYCGAHAFTIRPDLNNNKALVATMNKNLEPLGFTFDKETIEYLSSVDRDELVELWQWIVPILREKTGADKVYRPMYPNFPRQVMEASIVELYVNAIVHYLTDGQLVPVYEKNVRFPLINTDMKLQAISLGNEVDVIEMVAGLISANTSISQTDKDHLTAMARDEEGLFSDALGVVDQIPNKEVLSYVAGLVLRHGYVFDLTPYFTTATDVLRLATSLSGGDVSLATNTKFASFPRSMRRYLLGLLENAHCDLAEDMARHAKKWIRLGERLHPSEYNFERVNAAFDLIRNSKVQTYNGRVEEAILNVNTIDVLAVLEERAGEFARRLDDLLRDNASPYAQDKIIDSFLSVADQVSTPVLLQLIGHFSSRNVKELRTFLPKGDLAHMMVVDNDVPYIDQKNTYALVHGVVNVLKNRFLALPYLGKVYIEDDLKGYLIPSSQRSASKAMKVVTRGSRLPVHGNTNTVRGFIHWKNRIANWGGEDRTDVDLSAVIYDANWKTIDRVWYRELRDQWGMACHSGDIVNAPRPDGATEFIDLNIDALRRKGVRYVVFEVNSFTRQDFSKMELSFGWMEREWAESGEIFEPATVANKIDLTANAQISTPVIFDVENMVFIYADMTLEANIDHVNNIIGNANSTAIVVQALAEMWMTKVNLYELFTMHAEARGEIVDDRSKANFVFGVNEGDVTAFDIEKIMSEYLK